VVYAFRVPPRRLFPMLLLLVGAACAPGEAVTLPPEASTTSQTTIPPTTTTTTTLPPTTTTTVPTYTLTGEVRGGGWPLIDTVVTAGGKSATTIWDGSFSLAGVPAGPVTISRHGWMPEEVEWNGTVELDVVLEQRIVKAVRVVRTTAASRDEFDALLDLIDGTAVNTLVFDTKDETGYVLYESDVGFAHEIGSIRDLYDPKELVARAKDAGLYTITRIVTFEDEVWSRARPEDKIAGIWMNPLRKRNYEYPIQLAEEACALGFDEIQFDYLRFPSGESAKIAKRDHPTTGEERVAAIRAFLAAARERVHAAGCALSADLFSIVMSAPDEQGIGQKPEELSTVLDAVSPMIYPSHYSDGWLGFADPNEHPAEVTGEALDTGGPRLAPGTVLRPWIQGFWWTDAQIREAVDAAEARGLGWLIWNAAGNYEREWLGEAEQDE